jgi:prephenate dehydrogenase
MKLAVLGVGLIGGSIGMAARRRLGAEVTGFDLDPESLRAAARAGAIDHAASGVSEACEGAEAVFCAAPVGVLGEITAQALASAGDDCVVSDVGSTKRDIVAAIGEEPRFVGGHPLAGAETAGVENARADLFDGARWYLTPTRATGGILYDRLQRILAEIGARPQAIDAAAHDRAMATTSHLPHVVANVLARQAAGLQEGEERLPEVGPSLRDATRVAGANPAIWGDIFLGNREAIAAATAGAAAELAAAADLIRSGSAEKIAEWHAAAGGARARLLAGEASGGVLHELRVIVPNRPGIVAELALALGRGGVNIEDMALHPSADMSSGAVALWIAGPEAAERAASLVRELGHSVQVLDAAG